MGVRRTNTFGKPLRDFCVAVLVRVAVVLATSIPEAVEARYCKMLSSLLSILNRDSVPPFLNIDTLTISMHVPRGYRGGHKPCHRRANRGGNTRSAPPKDV